MLFFHIYMCAHFILAMLALLYNDTDIYYVWLLSLHVYVCILFHFLRVNG